MTQMNAMTAEYAVEVTFSVQAYDLDEAGLASEVAHVRWLTALRDVLLGQALPEMPAPSVPRLVASHIDYWHPLKKAEQLQGRMWLANLGDTQWTLQARLSTSAHTVAVATQRGDYLDASTLEPLMLPSATLKTYWEAQWRH